MSNELENEIKRLKTISGSHFTVYWIYMEDGNQLCTAYSIEEVKEILKKHGNCRVDRFTKNFNPH